MGWRLSSRLERMSASFSRALLIRVEAVQRDAQHQQDQAAESQAYREGGSYRASTVAAAHRASGRGRCGHAGTWRGAGGW